MQDETTIPDGATHYYREDSTWQAHYIKEADDGSTECWSRFHGAWIWSATVHHAPIVECVKLRGGDKLKRYMVFAHDDFYPAGGMGDFIGFYDTEEEAKAAGEAIGRDRVDIHDTEQDGWWKEYEGATY